MKLTEYKGQTCLTYSLVRLLPPNAEYPDCECFLFLTTKNLFVLEDNYDDTYTEQFAIPIKNILDMGFSSHMIPDSDTPHQAKHPFGITSSILTNGLLHKLLANKTSEPTGVNSKSTKEKYFRIYYLDNNDAKQEVFFTKWDLGIKKIRKHWKSQYKQ